MGKRTSVYLSDEIAEAVRASGRKLSELIAAGLARESPPAPDSAARRAWLRELVARELAAMDGESGAPAPPAVAHRAESPDEPTAPALVPPPTGAAPVPPIPLVAPPPAAPVPAANPEPGSGSCRHPVAAYDPGTGLCGLCGQEP
jgi:hypothetical protein